MAEQDCYVCSLGPEELAQAQEELKEKPEWRMRDIQAVRDMVNAHPGLHCPTTTSFLLRFLRAGKFDYDRTYQLIINYYTLKAQRKNYFDRCLPSLMKPVIDANTALVLPKKDKHGRWIYYERTGNFNTTTMEMADAMATIFMLLEIIVQEEDAQVKGVVIVFDFKGFTLGHLQLYEAEAAKTHAALMQGSFPVRVKQIYIVNQSSLFNVALSIIRPFLKQKMYERIRPIGEDYEKLADDLGTECLPTDLGGELDSLDKLCAEWNSKMMGKEDFFKEVMTHYLDLPRQIVKKPEKDEVIEGLVGTYKKLNV